MKSRLFAITLALFAMLPAFAQEAKMNLKPALNDPPAPVKAGVQPYEMEGRKESRAPIFGFEDLSGWTVELQEGAQADLVRTNEQQMWGRYVGKLSYKGTSSASSVVLRPPKPIPADGSFDSVAMWIYGNNWSWESDKTTPAVSIALLLLDKDGKEQSINLTNVVWKEWWWAHKKLTALMDGASLAGIRISNMSNDQERAIYLDSVYLYKETLKPLKFEPRPKRNLKLFPGQYPGLNTGPGTLPFPTREETILPTNFESRFSNSVSETSDGVYEFTYKGRDCTVSYTYHPRAGGLGEIEANVNGKKVCVPMATGGIDLGANAGAEGKLISQELKDGVLSLVFELGEPAVRAEYAFRIWQKSLVMDFICRGANAAGVQFGEIREVQDPKLVLIPYLTLGSNPRVLCCGRPDSPAFVSVWDDWYRSNGSSLWSAEWARFDAAKINGGVKYIAKTDGKRNDLYERVFLTVSPTFEETLPTIANPPTPLAKIAGERLWQESWGPDNYAKQHGRSKMLRSYGIDKLTQCNHEITWRDGGESFTVRTKSAPGKGGDEALKQYVAGQRSLGWLSGLYTNYTDFAPVNENWDEDKVQMTPEGELRTAWPRCYALKPSSAVEFDEKLAPIIQKKFGSNAAYTDVHTAVAPWQYCDFDARVPGAGTFAATFYAYGELLLHDQKIYGPSWSEGSYHWLSAGLATGNYGLSYPMPDFSKEPLNVAFDLMKIHTLECDIGMPWTGGFFKDAAWSKPENVERSVDHFIGATMAYGHIGWLVEEDFGIRRTCRSYYMLQQLQKRYALQRPVKIQYADADGRFLTASQAIATDVIEQSRLHVVYANGLEIYVNGSEADWKIADDFVLPSWGWYAHDRQKRFEEYSGIFDGHRIDHVQSQEYEYLDGRGVPTVYRDLAATGAIAVRKSKSSIEVIDVDGNEEIGIGAPRVFTCTAYDAEGKSLGSVRVRHTDAPMCWITTVKNARRYALKESQAWLKESLAGKHKSVEVSVAFAKDTVVPGEEMGAGVLVLPTKDVTVKKVTVQIEGSEPVSVPELEGPGMRDQARSHGVPLRFPGSLKIGKHAWVRVYVEDAAGESNEILHELQVVPAYRVSLVELGKNRFKLETRCNLRIDPLVEPGITVLPEDASFAVRRDAADPSIFTLTSSSVTGEKDLKVRAEVGEDIFKQAAEFALSAVPEQPVIEELPGEQGFSWGYAFRGKPEQQGNTFGTGEASGALVYPDNMACGGVVKRGLFVHPPWVDGVGYTYISTGAVKVPAKPCEFRTWIGIKDGSAQTDGVDFVVNVIDGKGGVHPLLKENWKEHKWNEVRADLAEFAGQTVSFRLTSDVGPADNSSSDWACWGDPAIVEKKPVMKFTLAR